MTERAVDVTMRRPHLAGLPAADPLPVGCEVRSVRVDEAAALASLLGRAFEQRWDQDDVERDLLCDVTVLETMVVVSGERLLATASLQVRPEAPRTGWVRWVATDPGRRREGLARALVLRVLGLSAGASCLDARVGTQTDRLAAIALYMQLGFEPLIASDWDSRLWDRVLAAVRREDA